MLGMVNLQHNHLKLENSESLPENMENQVLSYCQPSSKNYNKKMRNYEQIETKNINLAEKLDEEKRRSMDKLCLKTLVLLR